VGNVPRTGQKNVDYALSYLQNEIRELKKSLINPRGKDYEGGEGDIRFVEDIDGRQYLEARSRNIWYTTFLGVFKEKIPGQRPYPFFEKLIVDELYASKFIVNQIESTREVLVSMGGAEVEKVTANTITFKDVNSDKTCPFAANDLILCRQIALDKGLEVRKVKATVSAVNGNVVTVTLNYGVPRPGDVFVHVGNTTNSARQNSILLSVNDDNAPFIDFYEGINSWAAWETAAGSKTKTRIGKLDGVTSPSFGALSGMGAYFLNGIYIEDGSINIANPGDINVSDLNNDEDWAALPTYTNGASFPVSPNTGDWHFYTKDPPDSPYNTNTWYKYSGSVWENYGLLGTYIDGTGLYTGTIVADNILTGTLNVGLTMTTGGSLTVGNLTGQRMVLDGTNNSLYFYDSNGDFSGRFFGQHNASPPYTTLTAYTDHFYVLGAISNFSGNLNINGAITGSSINASGGDVYAGTYVNALSGFQHNSSATSGNYLRGNGTYFVSSAIQAGDLPSHSHSASNITSGTLDIARGGTGASSFTANRVAIVNGVGSALTSSSVTTTTLGYLDIASSLTGLLNTKVTASTVWGSPGTAYWVALSLGGSPIGEVKVIPTTINGTTYNLLYKT
jgi:hypothetical protein